MTTIVETQKLTKEYRGVPAIKAIDFELREGEIHALLGENGAGKSTLAKIIAGAVEPTAGRLLHRGAPVRYASPSEALRAGIAMVFQESSLVPSMTVAQNLYLGDEKFLNRLRGIYIAAQQFLQSLNFPVDPTATVATLGAAKRQMVEIARAVHHNAGVIIFDEPTAALTPEEKRHFFALMRRLRERGVSIIFISHALEEALAHSDRITILRDGEHVITDDTPSFDRDSVIRAMVGRTLSTELYNTRRQARSAAPRRRQGAVRAGHLHGQYRAQQLLFDLRRADHRRLRSDRLRPHRDLQDRVRHLQARLSPWRDVELDGRPVRYNVPRPAVKDRIVYVTEDRKTEGYFETMSVAENFFSGLLAAGLERLPYVSMREMRELAADWSGRLNIRAINRNARVVELSGGNQQKVVIGKGLIEKPRLVIFDEPTRGVDVGAIAEIHHFINELADQGLAVVVISSYLPEIMNLSDRILVCRQGRVVEEFTPADATEERIMYAAVH